MKDGISTNFYVPSTWPAAVFSNGIMPWVCLKMGLRRSPSHVVLLNGKMLWSKNYDGILWWDLGATDYSQRILNFWVVWLEDVGRMFSHWAIHMVGTAGNWWIDLNWNEDVDVRSLRTRNCAFFADGKLSMFIMNFQLVGGLEPWNFMTFHSLANFIIPTD